MNFFSTTLWHRWLRRPYTLNIALDEGHGKTIVLLHGIASSGSVWRSLAAELAASNRRVIAYDLVGFGGSPKPDWLAYTVEDHSREVLASLKRDRVKGPITVVGHSMGCLVAVHLAAKDPQRFNRVILYEPPLFADVPEFSSHARRRKIYLSMYERIADSPTMMLAYAKLLGRAAAKVAGIALRPEDWLPFERSLRNTIINQTAYAELHDIKVPTDIVYGRLDIVVTRADVQAMFQDNKYIRFHAVTDIHGISRKSSRYLANLIAKPRKKHKQRVASRRSKQDNKKTRKAGV